MRYKEAGVDISSLNEVKRRIKDLVKGTFNQDVLEGLGLFGGLYRIGNKIIVSSVDGVGTKLKIATMANNHHFVGFDIVNHCVNDILTLGARPLFFLDYIAFSELAPQKLLEVLESLSNACQKAKIALIGGETAQLPGYFKADDFDLVGFIAGIAEEGSLITGHDISAGDRLIGLPASGLHTNGYSLVRKIFFDEKGYDVDRYFPDLKKTLAEELLIPHRSYLDQVTRVRPMIKGIVHITGGGFIDNIPRILPDGLGVLIKKDNWGVPPIFRLIKDLGSVSEDEMFRTFNMGIGMILIVDPDSSEEVKEMSGGIEIGEVSTKKGVRIK